MKCPYLSDDSDEKTCSQMIKQGLEGELDDFDITHYCKGNPNHCYFYRSCKVHNQANEQTGDHKPEKIQVAFYDELSKLKLGEAEILIDQDDPYPLCFKLVKRGFRYRVKPKPAGQWIAKATKEK